MIEALRKLKEEVKNQREETTSLKKALQECLACKIKKPQCSDDPPPCYPKYFSIIKNAKAVKITLTFLKELSAEIQMMVLFAVLVHLVSKEMANSANGMLALKIPAIRVLHVTAQLNNLFSGLIRITSFFWLEITFITPKVWPMSARIPGRWYHMPAISLPK